MSDITQHTDYCQALATIKQRIQTSRTRAVLAVNAELLGLYWDIGRQLAGRLAARAGVGLGRGGADGARSASQLPRHEGLFAQQPVCHAAVLCLLRFTV